MQREQWQIKYLPRKSELTNTTSTRPVAEALPTPLHRNPGHATANMHCQGYPDTNRADICVRKTRVPNF